MKVPRLFIISAVVLLVAALGLCVESDLVTLDNSAFKNPQRPAAWFDHDDHNEKAALEDDCAVCHHVYENKILIQDESSEDSLCSDCHTIKKTNSNGISLRAAFHKQCKACHFSSKKGPVLCGECHKKRG